MFVEYPLMDARVIGWMTEKYRVSGFEYWDYTSYGSSYNKRTGKLPTGEAWVTAPGGVLTTAWIFNRAKSGDGYLCYPGKNNTPINSLRFESLRDGLEDNELLHQLRGKLTKLSGAKKKEAKEILAGDSVVTNAHIFTIDPQTLMETRKRIFALLK